jgi:NADPH-dependent ferric siderophore reductase
MGALTSAQRQLSRRLLVDLIHMSPDRLLELVGVAGGPLADAALWDFEVLSAGPLSPNLHRLELTAPGLAGLRYTAGQDLMFRIPLAEDRVVNRRYTIRAFDAERAVVTIDISLHANGPGTDWIRAARIGDRIDAIGPRGKITLQTDADWHLFVADETGMPGVLAMVETLPSPSIALALIEIDTPADEQVPDSAQRLELDLRWLYRMERRSVPGDASLLLDALTGLELPVGAGHAYIAAEARVVKAIQQSLTDRGFEKDRISGKAYWRRGLPNAEHGEPSRDE